MMQDIPDDVVERTLKVAKGFAQIMVPIIGAACDHGARLIRTRPEGGVAVDNVERQGHPMLARVAAHQLIAGHNQRVAEADRIGVGRVSNASLPLSKSGQRIQVLKKRAVFPIRRSGPNQEAVIDQARLQELLYGPQLFDVDPETIFADTLFIWATENMELVAAHVVVPNGFLPEGGVRIVASEEIPIDGNLEDLATFGTDNTGVVIEPNDIFRPTAKVSEMTLPDEDEDDSVFGRETADEEDER